MCLIIHRPKGAPAIHEGWIKDFVDTNSDGFGIWWIEDDEVKVEKTLTGLDHIIELIRAREAADVEFGCHFRMATHGAVAIENVHPYAIFSVEGRPKSIATVVAHNGVLSEFGGVRGTGKSDTLYFVDDMLRPVMTAFGTDAVMRDEASGGYRMVKRILGYTNRLLIVDHNSGFARLGGEWTPWKGLHLSNTYAWSYTKRDREVPTDSTPFGVSGKQLTLIESEAGNGFWLKNGSKFEWITRTEAARLQKRWGAQVSTVTPKRGASFTGSASGNEKNSESGSDTSSTATESAASLTSSGSLEPNKPGESSKAQSDGDQTQKASDKRARCAKCKFVLKAVSMCRMTECPNPLLNGKAGSAGRARKSNSTRLAKRARLPFNDATVEGGTKADNIAALVASMDYGSVVEWCKHEPEEAATAMQELSWEAYGRTWEDVDFYNLRKE